MPSTKDKTIHEIARDIAVWLITAVIGFLGYNTWQTGLAIRELTIEIKHVIDNDNDHSTDIATIRKEISTVRQEQSTQSAFAATMFKELNQRLSQLEKLNRN